MQIPGALMGKWLELHSHGDGKKIAEANPGITKDEISRAFKKGECSDEVFQAIAGFYQEKQERLVNPFLTDADSNVA